MPSPTYSTIPAVPPSPPRRPRSRYFPLLLLGLGVLISPLLISQIFPAAIPSVRNYIAHLDHSPAVRCTLPPPSTEACADFEIKGFYFDKESGTCKKFIWRGCPGAVPFWWRGGCRKANCPARTEYPKVSPTPSATPTPSVTPTPSPAPVIPPKRVFFANWAEPSYRLTMFGTQGDVVGTYNGYVYTDQTWVLFPTDKEDFYVLRNGRKLDKVLAVGEGLSVVTKALSAEDEPSEDMIWYVQDPEDPQYPEGAVMLRSAAYPTYLIKMTGKGIGGLGMSEAYADDSHLWKVVDCDLELNADEQAVCYP